MRDNVSIPVPYQIVSVFGEPIGDNGKDEVIYYCPECLNRRGKPDKDGKLYVNTKTFKYHCFKCNYSGSIDRRTKFDSSRIYDDTKDSDLELLAVEAESIDNADRFPLKVPIDKIFTSDKAVKYLIDRGFTEEQFEYYDLRVGNLNMNFGRIVIPNEINKRVYTDYYSARTFINQKPKYLNPYSKKSSIVFNLHRIQEGSPIIVVEGALTAIAAGHNAVATLGKTMSRMQASQIASKRPSIVYINYDFGAEQWSRDACKLMKSLLPDTPIMEVLMKDDRDAADLTHEEYANCLRNAVEYIPIYEEVTQLFD